MSVDPLARTALKKLMDPKRYFSICDFDHICKVLNVIPPRGHRDRLALVHCIYYRDMDADVREEVARLVYESLNSPGFEIDIESFEVGAEKVTPITGRIIKRLKGDS